ncbi:hypothetical protein AJ87_47370 [Rhizobium yanglingense]|nr:hypothetical protein AJ87_47370 [Rhizobium yanglingense]
MALPCFLIHKQRGPLFTLSKQQFRHLRLIGLCPHLVACAAAGGGAKAVKAGIVGRKVEGSVEIGEGARYASLLK